MGYMIIIELIIDTRDAMGANVINTMCELVGSELEKLTKCTVILKFFRIIQQKEWLDVKLFFQKNWLVAWMV